jgi:hypothetical protein
VGPGQGPAADPGVEAERHWRHRLDLGRALHVAQLAPVVVAVDVGALGPAQEDVAGGLQHPLTLDHPLAVLLAAALPEVALQDRGGCLLDLQEQRVALVAALEQDDEGPGADAAHPHHLAGQVDEPEPLQQLALIVAEGGPVGPELRMERVFDLLLGEAVGGVHVPGWDHDRGLAHDPVLAVDHLGELGQRLQAVTRPGLGGVPAGGLLGPPGDLRPFLGLRGLRGGAANRLHELVLGQVGIPDLHCAHPGEAGHRLPIGGHRPQRGRLGVGLGEAVVASGDGEAGRQPLDVVLERPRQGLVEVVEVEQQPPLGRGEDPEVGEVGVAAQLDGEAGRGRAGQVGGHDLGRAPVEGERRDQHAAVPDRHQVRLTGQVLLGQQRHRSGRPGAGTQPA